MFFKKKKKVKKISFTQMCYTNSICIEAVVNTLVKKGVCKREEVLEEVKRLTHIAKEGK